MPFAVPGPAGANGSNGAAGTGTIIVQDEGAVVGTASILNFVGSGVAATFSNGTATATVSSSGSGSVLGGTAVTAAGTTTTGTTIGTVNAAIHVPFVGPASGAVIVTVHIQAFNNQTTGSLYLALMNAAFGTVAGPYQVATPEGETAGNTRVVARTFYISGLSAGTAYDYYLASKHTVNSWTMRWDGALDSHGPATLTVMAMP